MSGSDVFYLGKGLLALLFKLKTKVMKSFLLLTFMMTAFAGFCQQTCLITKVIDACVDLIYTVARVHSSHF